MPTNPRHDANEAEGHGVPSTRGMWLIPALAALGLALSFLSGPEHLDPDSRSAGLLVFSSVTQWPDAFRLEGQDRIEREARPVLRPSSSLADA